MQKVQEAEVEEEAGPKKIYIGDSAKETLVAQLRTGRKDLLVFKDKKVRHIALHHDGKTRMKIQSSLDSVMSTHELLTEELAKRGIQRRGTTKLILRSLEKSANYLDGVLTGIEDQGVTTKEIKRVVFTARAEMGQCLRMVKLKLSTHKEEDAKEQELSGADEEVQTLLEIGKKADFDISEELAQAITAVSREATHNYTGYNPKKMAQQMYRNEQVRGLMSKFSKYKKDLPSVKTSEDPFKVLKLPVIPVFNMPVDTEHLKAAGLPVAGTVGWYSVLGRQTVLAINTRHVKEIGISAYEYAEEITSVLGKKLGGKYFIITPTRSQSVGKKFYPDGFVYFWLMPEKEINQLNKLTMTRGVPIQDWGLAIPGASEE